MNDICDELARIKKTFHKKCARMLLELIVLCLIKEDGLSGYDLMTAINNKFLVLMSPGTLYPLLYSFEREGLLDVREAKRKKIYQLTDKGKTYVSLLSDEYSKFQSMLDPVLSG